MNNWIAKNIVYKFIEQVRGEQVSKHLKYIAHIPFLSHDELKQLQAEKLTHTIKNAYKNIPFYKKLYDESGLDIKNFSFPDDIEKLPVITKQTVRTNYKNLKNNYIRVRVSKETTSGTSGNPFTVLKDRERSAHLRAVMYRCYRQHGIDIGDKQARFWGVPIKKNEFWLENLKDLLANRIRISAFNLGNKELQQYVKKIRRFKPIYIYGYPSTIYRFSQWLNENDIFLKGLNFAAIITTGEVLYPSQRKLIESVFNCRIANEYGTTEAGVLAFECKKNNMHINMDHVFIEQVSAPNLNGNGRIVITELNNQYNPLIRYDVGDIGFISNKSCSCGINFHVLDNLVGRDSTNIVTPDGHFVNDGILEYVLQDGIRQFQGFQKDSNELLIKIVKGKDFTDKKLDMYLKEFRRFLGKKINIKIEFVHKIEPEKSGKLRYFVSNLLC